MAKEPKSQKLTLSRYFQENIETQKNRNLFEDFEKSSDFYIIVDEKQNVERRKNAKRRMFGPQLKGFSSEDLEHSEINKNRMLQLLTQIENNIEEPKEFVGFSKKEINCSKKLCDKNNEKLKEETYILKKFCDTYNKEIKHIETNDLHFFRGFSKQEQNDSVSQLSDILEKCVSIRNDIYKSIDRRILTYHLKEEKSKAKNIRSKYWPKQENCSSILEDEHQLKKNKVRFGNISKFRNINDFAINKNHRKNNGVKKETNKTEINRLKPEDDFVLEINKLKQELKAMRNDLSPSKDTKLDDSLFMQIKKELIIPPFRPPKSPHNLIEEDLYYDPWALLVATIFLNKTSCRTARPYVFWFLDENPDPLIVLGKRVEELETYFGALGLQKTRASQVWRMSHDFIYKKWQKVSELHGIGKYGEDAFRMFCLGDFSVEPKDRFLRIYKAWYEMQERTARLTEMNS